jgi:hypothetical protein
VTWASLWWRICLLARIELRHARAVWLVWQRNHRILRVRIAPPIAPPVPTDTGLMCQTSLRGYLMTDAGATLVVGDCYITDNRYVPVVATRVRAPAPELMSQQPANPRG